MALPRLEVSVTCIGILCQWLILRAKDHCRKPETCLLSLRVNVARSASIASFRAVAAARSPPPSMHPPRRVRAARHLDLRDRDQDFGARLEVGGFQQRLLLLVAVGAHHRERV